MGELQSTWWPGRACWPRGAGAEARGCLVEVVDAVGATEETSLRLHEMDAATVDAYIRAPAEGLVKDGASPSGVGNVS